MHTLFTRRTSHLAASLLQLMLPSCCHTSIHHTKKHYTYTDMSAATAKLSSYLSSPPSSGSETKAELGEGSTQPQHEKDATPEGQLGNAPPGMPEVPEGGKRGWMAVAGCWCALFFTFGYVNSFGCVRLSTIMVFFACALD